MKNLFRTLLVLMLAVSCVFALASCDVLDEILANIPGMSTGDQNEGEGEGNENEGNEDDGNVELEGLALIVNGKAKFQIVQASSKGAPVRAKNLYDKLKGLGIELESPIGDADSGKVTDYEIIIGADIRNREDCVISSRYLGEDGYQIKVVGNKVVIAGGSDKSLSKACEIFTTQILKITGKTKEGDIDNLAIPYETNELKLHTYLITSLTIAGNPISEYTLVTDTATVSGSYELTAIKSFREDLYSNTGAWLETGTMDKLDTYAHKIVIRYTTDKLTNDNGDGFVGYVDAAGDLYIECNYQNSFNKAFASFVKKHIFDKMGEVTIAKNFLKTEVVSRVYYSEFGAVGNGKVDDFKAILATHRYANEGGQKVMGDKDAKYYISDEFTESVIIKTDTDFNGATFIVNDKGSTAYKYRSLELFKIDRDYPYKSYNKTQIEELCGTGLTVSMTDTEFPWLAPLLEAKSIVRFINDTHRDFIRHGANENSGSTRRDTYIVNPDGTLEADVPIAFEFDLITKIEIWRADDTPITVENGFFENLCCETVIETQFKCLYHAYYRGFKIYRSNTTFRNIKHTMVDEPTLNVNAQKDKNGDLKSGTATWGTRDESYPYYGFFHVQQSYNVLGEDLILDGHTTYYEDKPATASTGSVPNPVPMGSYDIIIENSSRTYLKNVVQQDNEHTGLGDERYWGIMSSNFTKNVFFEDCAINRFDAHQGFWNATLIDTTIGHSFNVVGGGKLYCERVTKITGNSFIYHRGDYGATFNGDIELVDCTLIGMKDYFSNQATPGKEDYNNLHTSGVVINAGFATSDSGSVVYETNEDGTYKLDANGEKIVKKEGRYWYWDFGYTCYMPRNIIVDGFKSNCGTLYMFNELPDAIFSDIPNQYQITESITYRNMEPLTICYSSEYYNKLRQIPTTVEYD